MSFESLSKKDLVEVAQQFAVDSTGTKADILAALEAEGVDWDLYQAVSKNSDDAVAAAAPVSSAPSAPTGEEVIIQFTGGGTYAGPGLSVSATQPFAVVDSSVAERLVSRRPDKFRIGTIEELNEFYG